MKIGKLSSESDKVVSFVLLVCMTIILAGCFMGVFYLQEYGFYTEKKGETAKNYAVYLYSSEDVKLAKDYFFSRETEINHSEEIRGYKSKYYETRFSADKSNFVFAVYNTDGELLFDSLNPEKNGDAEQTFETADIDSDYTGQSDFLIFDENSVPGMLRIKYGIIEPEKQTANDRYSSAFQWIDLAYMLRYFVFAVLFVALSFIIFLLIMFAVNAGDVDEETGEIIPGFIDKLPFDFVTVSTALLFLLPNVIYGLVQVADAEMVLSNVVVMLIFVVAVIVILMYVTTVSVRFKIYLRENSKKTLQHKE